MRNNLPAKGLRLELDGAGESFDFFHACGQTSFGGVSVAREVRVGKV